MLPSLSLLSCEVSVSVKENTDRKKYFQKKGGCCCQDRGYVNI